MRISLARLTLVAALVAAHASASTAAAQASTPRSASESALRDLIRVMNIGNRDSLERFVGERFVTSGPGSVPTADRVERLQRLHSILGDLTIRTVDSVSRSRASGIAQSNRTESWRRFAVMLDTAPPNRILRVGVAPAGAPDAPTRRLSDAEVVEQLRAYMERLARRDVFSGTVLARQRWQAAFQRRVMAKRTRTSASKHCRYQVQPWLDEQNVHVRGDHAAGRGGQGLLDDTLGKFLPAGAMHSDVLSKVRVQASADAYLGARQLLQPALGQPLASDVPQRRRLDAAGEGRVAGVRAGHALVVQQHRHAPAREGDRGGEWQDYFDYVRERSSKPAGMTYTDAYELDRVTKTLPSDTNASFEPTAAEQYRNNIFHARHSWRAGRRRLLDRRGSRAVRRGAQGGAARQSRRRSAADDAEARAELTRLRIRLRPGRRRPHRRAQRRVPRASAPSSTSSSRRVRWR